MVEQLEFHPEIWQFELDKTVHVENEDLIRENWDLTEQKCLSNHVASTLEAT